MTQQVDLAGDLGSSVVGAPGSVGLFRFERSWPVDIKPAAAVRVASSVWFGAHAYGAAFGVAP